MKTQMDLKVTPSEFYGLLLSSLLTDIEKSTGKEPDITTIKPGYSYTKNIYMEIGRPKKAKVVIDHLNVNILYGVHVENPYGKTFLSYRLEPLESGCRVYYEELMENHSIINSLNYKLMSFVRNKSLVKRANTLLISMENHIVSNRGN